MSLHVTPFSVSNMALNHLIIHQHTTHVTPFLVSNMALNHLIIHQHTTTFRLISLKLYICLHKWVPWLCIVMCESTIPLWWKALIYLIIFNKGAMQGLKSGTIASQIKCATSELQCLVLYCVINESILLVKIPQYCVFKKALNKLLCRQESFSKKQI